MIKVMVLEIKMTQSLKILMLRIKQTLNLKISMSNKSFCSMSDQLKLFVLN